MKPNRPYPPTYYDQIEDYVGRMNERLLKYNARRDEYQRNAIEMDRVISDLERSIAKRRKQLYDAKARGWY